MAGSVGYNLCPAANVINGGHAITVESIVPLI